MPLVLELLYKVKGYAYINIVCLRLAYHWAKALVKKIIATS